MLSQAAKILVVDDLEHNRYLAEQLLSREGYHVSTAADGKEALEKIAREKPDLVLLDVSMPQLDGLSVLRTLRSKRETELLPVILVTVQSDSTDKVRGLDAGASDFLAKPWEAGELLARVRAHLRVKMLTAELERAEEVLFMLAQVVEARDAYTMEHTERVTRNALSIGRAAHLPSAALQTLRKGAMLHDIGKIGLPDAILRKPGPLNDEEWKRMQQHPDIGIQIVSSLQSLGEALQIIRHHHERWDGKGYPAKLAGEDIPLLARIVAIADAFDAMTSDRPYRRGITIAEARHIIEQGAGNTWDPQLVAMALRVLPSDV